MTDAYFVYYWSPWATWLMASLIFFFFIVLFYGLYRRQRIILEKGGATYLFGMIGTLIGVALIAFLVISRAVQPGAPRLVIHRDYLSCGSWTHENRYMRVPWRSFAGISNERYGRFFLDISLRFDLDHRYLSETPWTDWVQSHGWVRCQIDGLTDDPRRFAFATDTDEILAQVLAAWRDSLNREAPANRPALEYYELAPWGAPRSTQPGQQR